MRSAIRLEGWSRIFWGELKSLNCSQAVLQDADRQWKIPQAFSDRLNQEFMFKIATLAERRGDQDMNLEPKLQLHEVII